MRLLDRIARAWGYVPESEFRIEADSASFWASRARSLEHQLTAANTDRRFALDREQATARRFAEYRAATVGRRITDAETTPDGARATYALKAPAFEL